jgi:hypothetical protein
LICCTHATCWRSSGELTGGCPTTGWTRDAANSQTFTDYLLRLTELKVAARTANTLAARLLVMTGKSYRFRETMKDKCKKKAKGGVV